MDDIKNNLISGACPNCHQPVLAQYYFCPNCGYNLNTAPLSTTAGMQAQIYLFSIVLPFILFLFIGKWPATKYVKSDDPKAKQIGYIAWALLIISTIAIIWLSIVWTQSMIQSTVNGINTDFTGL